MRGEAVRKAEAAKEMLRPRMNGRGDFVLSVVRQSDGPRISVCHLCS